MMPNEDHTRHARRVAQKTPEHKLVVMLWVPGTVDDIAEKIPYGDGVGKHIADVLDAVIRCEVGA